MVTIIARGQLNPIELLAGGVVDQFDQRRYTLCGRPQLIELNNHGDLISNEGPPRRFDVPNRQVTQRFIRSQRHGEDGNRMGAKPPQHTSVGRVGGSAIGEHDDAADGARRRALHRLLQRRAEPSSLSGRLVKLHGGDRFGLGRHYGGRGQIERAVMKPQPHDLAALGKVPPHDCMFIEQ